MMNSNRNFAVFIPSHGRAETIITPHTLRDLGYTGKIFIVCDDEDEQLDRYKAVYQDSLIVFSKKEYSFIDTMDTNTDRKGVVYARIFIPHAAKQKKCTHFCVIDDDLLGLDFRFEREGKLVIKRITDADAVFDAMLDLLDSTSINCIAFAQGGDFVGGLDNKNYLNKYSRKVMNSFFCKASSFLDFRGRVNEDVVAYVLGGMRGQLNFTTYDICLNQRTTQKVSGGLTELYRQQGTYIKTMYSVLAAPGIVKISTTGKSSPRVHHHVSGNACYPLIISEKFKK